MLRCYWTDVSDRAPRRGDSSPWSYDGGHTQSAPPHSLRTLPLTKSLTCGALQHQSSSHSKEWWCHSWCSADVVPRTLRKLCAMAGIGLSLQIVVFVRGTYQQTGTTRKVHDLCWLPISWFLEYKEIFFSQLPSMKQVSLDLKQPTPSVQFNRMSKINIWTIDHDKNQWRTSIVFWNLPVW